MQKVSRGGRRSPLGRLGSQEALEGENIETLQQPTKNRRSWPRVALSGAIKERDIHWSPSPVFKRKRSGASWRQFGGPLGERIGSVLEASRGCIGGRFRASWGLFGASWVPLWASWSLLGPSWGPLGASWGPLGPEGWNSLFGVPFLGLSWGRLGVLLARLGRL